MPAASSPCHTPKHRTCRRPMPAASSPCHTPKHCACRRRLDGRCRLPLARAIRPRIVPVDGRCRLPLAHTIKHHTILIKGSHTVLRIHSRTWKVQTTVWELVAAILAFTQHIFVTSDAISAGEPEFVRRWKKKKMMPLVFTVTCFAIWVSPCAWTPTSQPSSPAAAT